MNNPKLIEVKTENGTCNMDFGFQISEIHESEFGWLFQSKTLSVSQADTEMIESSTC